LKNSDIRPLGASDGFGYYWVKAGGGTFGGASLQLVAISDVGEVTDTGLRKAYDHAARTRQEAVVEHLSSGLSQADADLERRRKDAPEPEPEPEPMDPATRKFLNDESAIPLEMLPAWKFPRY
jgi:hypothetical protein